MPLLKVDYSGKHLRAKYESVETKKQPAGTQKEDIHAFDGNHLSMPSYSLKYKNEANAGAMRHLLGGKVINGEGINQSDIRSSNLHWAMGLRYYNPQNDVYKKHTDRENSSTPNRTPNLTQNASKKYI